MAEAWTEREAVHLLSRAAFLAGPKEVEAAQALGRKETVRRLIAGEPLTGEAYALQPIGQLTADGKLLDETQIGDQQAFWIHRMANAHAPLHEKIALFWHGHFATSYEKVREIPLLLRQANLFRQKGLGDFRELVLEVGRDPAMLLFLDNNNNRKGRPNENYAREVMELFTLGVGHYSEQDVRDAARAMTGWSYNKKTDIVKFTPKEHDTDLKTILGETRPFNDEEFLEQLFRQESLPRFIVRKLLAFFATENPAEALVDPLVQVFSKSFHIGETLEALFTSDAFYAEEHYGCLVKSPAEFTAGILRAFEVAVNKNAVNALKKMGQELYMPPDVSGWAGGAAWLMTSNLLARYQFAEGISKQLDSSWFSAGPLKMEAGAEALEWITRFSRQAGLWKLGEQTTRALTTYVSESVLAGGAQEQGARGLLQLAMISPEAQMK